MNGTEITVVTPVYEDAEAASKLFTELAKVFDGRAYVVAVDDGSLRAPVKPGVIAAAGLTGVVIRLRRNVGHQRAIAVGLSYVADKFPGTERIVIMDSDGEDTPQSVPALLEVLDNQDVDVAIAKRRRRVETVRFKAFYVVYRLLFEVLTGRRITFGNFMALKPAALKRLAAMHELWIHVAGCVLVSKLRLAERSLDRGPRYAGISKMNFVGLALHGFRAPMVFAEDVLVRVGIGCTIVATLSIAGGAAAVVLKLFGLATPGWFSVALGILLLVFLQTGALTLMTLLLAGVVRGGATSIDYRQFVSELLLVPSETTD